MPRPTLRFISVDRCSCVHVQVSGTAKTLISNNELSPHTTFIWVSIFYLGGVTVLTLHVSLLYLLHSKLKELLPNTYFYMALYIQFCNRLGITFTRPVFLFKIDHDDGTVKHILSRLEAAQEQYNECSISHKHRVDCCIIT